MRLLMNGLARKKTRICCHRMAITNATIMRKTTFLTR
jgi:hypothetical protein